LGSGKLNVLLVGIYLIKGSTTTWEVFTPLVRLEEFAHKRGFGDLQFSTKEFTPGYSRGIELLKIPLSDSY